MADFNPYDYRPNLDHLLIIDITDILQDMHDTILSQGEKPAYEHFNHEMLASFLFDVYMELGYLPEGKRFVSHNVSNVLDTADLYFEVASLTALQREAWFTAAQKIVDRFVEYKLYDPKSSIHNYDFHDYVNGTLYLRKP